MTDTETTLHVRVEPTTAFVEDVREDLQKVERGEEIDETHVVSLPDMAALERLLNEKNVELLQTVAREEPESVRAAARAVDRDVKNVSTALNELAELGFLRFEESGAAKRPVVWYDTIDIDLPIGQTAPAGNDAAVVG